jgi:scyllo-inositol 2-dehydrogenase (NADP+)
METTMAGKMSQIRCGIVGYGPAFNMGKYHADFITDTPGMKAVGVCDPVPERLATAQEELPGIATYGKLEDMLGEEELDLAVIITPHNTHARLAVQCMDAGKHVIVEKPMCITAKEARRMLDAAKDNDVMLSVFHNRRWDADYLTIRETVRQGLIGEIFEVDCHMGGWTPPRGWWREDKKISGGAFFDWGAHMLDWVLQLVDRPIADVTGFFHKRVWHKKTNADQVRAVIRFEGNVQADVSVSSIARISRSKWRILGDRGAIETQWGSDAITVVTELQGLETKMEIPNLPAAREEYYKNISAHLRKGAELVCKAEESALTIAVMDAAEKSAKSGRAAKIRL